MKVFVEIGNDLVARSISAFCRSRGCRVVYGDEERDLVLTDDENFVTESLSRGIAVAQIAWNTEIQHTSGTILSGQQFAYINLLESDDSVSPIEQMSAFFDSVRPQSD